MIDKTHSKMGKARPWMLYGYIGCAITLVACFAVPTSLGRTAQYAWFFIAYTLLNGVFYTANNIAYSALTSLVTKNSKERVQSGFLTVSFFAFFNQSSDSSSYCWIRCKMWWRCSRMAYGCNYLCSDRISCEYYFRIIC